MIVTAYIQPAEVYELSRRLRDWRQAYLFVRDKIRYVHEKGDKWKTPRETIRDMAGDCEDKAILLASILKAMGHDAWIRIARIRDPQGNVIDHAYVLLRQNVEWVPLDPSCPNCPPGVIAFTLIKPIIDFNDKVIIVHDPKLAENYVLR